MRTQLLAGLTLAGLLLYGGACLIAARIEARLPSRQPTPAKAVPIPTPKAGAVRPWYPGRVLWHSISFPFRKKAPRDPVCPPLWK